MDLHNLIITLCVYALPVIFAITLHEAAHGIVARQFGDSTAWMLGRVTLNPIKHIEPLGTVLLPVLTLWLGGFLFGWAKPVPVNFNNLRPERPGMFWVAAAGPGSNLLQMAIWALVAMILAATIDPKGLVGPFWLAVADAGIKVNIMFALLNLLPILPLDGGRIVSALLPPKLSYTWGQTERFGMLILLALIFTNVIGRILGPFYAGLYEFTLRVVGLA